jgi:hypothetical protein
LASTQQLRRAREDHEARLRGLIRARVHRAVVARALARIVAGLACLVLAGPAFPSAGARRPAYRVAAKDPATGARVQRIADDPGRPIAGLGGRWGADARHVYSKQQPWSADGAYLALQNRKGGTPSLVLLDGRTYAPRAKACAEVWDWRWHPSPARARVMIDVDQAGRTLSWLDALTCDRLRTWTLPIEADGFGMGEGNPSHDGRFVALANQDEVVVVDMDPQPPHRGYPARRVGPVYRLPPCGLGDAGCKVGNVSISPSGRYVDVKYSGRSSDTQDLHRILEVDPQTLALRPHAMAAASSRCGPVAARIDGWIFPLKHADMALDPFDGNRDVIVGGRSCPGSKLGRVVKVRLADGKVTALTNPKNEASVSHVSTRNVKRPGWAYVGYFERSGKRHSDEIVAVKLDGSGTVERIARQRSDSDDCYRCEPHPVPSPDGSRVVFASTWSEDCEDCGSDDAVEAYVVDQWTTRNLPARGPSGESRR